MFYVIIKNCRLHECISLLTSISLLPLVGVHSPRPIINFKDSKCSQELLITSSAPAPLFFFRILRISAFIWQRRLWIFFVTASMSTSRDSAIIRSAFDFKSRSLYCFKTTFHRIGDCSYSSISFVTFSGDHLKFDMSLSARADRERLRTSVNLSGVHTERDQ
jgi:hypothetical protein